MVATESASGSTTESQPSSPSSSFPIRTKDFRNWGLIRLAHEAMMLDKIGRQNRIVENTVKGMQGEAGLSPKESGLGGDDMGVSVGNEIHYHNQESSSNSRSGPSWLAPALATLLTASGTAAVMYALMNRATSTPSVEHGSDTSDTDTLTEITVGFGQPTNKDPS